MMNCEIRIAEKSLNPLSWDYVCFFLNRKIQSNILCIYSVLFVEKQLFQKLKLFSSLYALEFIANVCISFENENDGTYDSRLRDRCVSLHIFASERIQMNKNGKFSFIQDAVLFSKQGHHRRHIIANIYTVECVAYFSMFPLGNLFEFAISDSFSFIFLLWWYFLQKEMRYVFLFFIYFLL